MDVGELQRRLSQKAERAPTHRFGDLYNLLYDTTWLRLAHDHVAQNAGAVTAGCDGITLRVFDEHRDENLDQLAQALRTETFEPAPVRRVYIPKRTGKVRPLGIPALRDRIVQEAVRMILEPIYEADFSPYSFGFRPTRCTMDAIKCVRWSTQEHKKYFWVIEGDIASCFDTIHHKRLLKLLRRRIRDRKLLRLIQHFLRAGVMDGKLWRDTTQGTPQGGIISPLLANIYLHELDRYLARYTALPTREKNKRRRRGQANYISVRYADDFVVLSNGTKAAVEALKEEIHTFLKTHLKLHLSREKTKVTHLNDGVVFLGFKIQRTVGHAGMKTQLFIPEAAVERVVEKITHITAPSTHQDAVNAKIQALNRVMGGWCRYYQYTSKASSVFHRLAYAANGRLARWLSRKLRLSLPEVRRRYQRDGTLATPECQLVKVGQAFPTRLYKGRFLKPNPYTTQEPLWRETLLPETYWSGQEPRPGMADLRPAVLRRAQYRCQHCGLEVAPDTAQVDHIRPVKRFKRPVEANRLDNLQTLCRPCHKAKTQVDQQRESRVQ